MCYSGNKERGQVSRMGDPEDQVFRKGVWFGEDFSQETGLQVGEIEFILCEEGKNHNNFERKSGQH